MTTCRQAKLDDLAAIQNIGGLTFEETFAPFNSPENMASYLAERFSEKQLESELVSPNSQFFLAWDNDKAVGYLKVNVADAQTEYQEPDGLEIERIYVREDYHGKGVGLDLLYRALEIAVIEGKNYVWLGVWEKNERAIRFYQKHNFRVVDRHEFILGNEVQLDYIMRRELK
jgi:ribosomal protein S18 acetylase RimI-like enzyme